MTFAKRTVAFLAMCLAHVYSSGCEPYKAGDPAFWHTKNGILPVKLKAYIAKHDKWDVIFEKPFRGRTDWGVEANDLSLKTGQLVKVRNWDNQRGQAYKGFDGIVLQVKFLDKSGKYSVQKPTPEVIKHWEHHSMKHEYGKQPIGWWSSRHFKRTQLVIFVPKTKKSGAPEKKREAELRAEKKREAELAEKKREEDIRAKKSRDGPSKPVKTKNTVVTTKASIASQAVKAKKASSKVKAKPN